MSPPAESAAPRAAGPKQDSERRLIRGSTLLLLGRLISKLTNFATQVLIVRYLSQSTFGGFAYALSVVGLAQSVVSLGLDRSIVRFLPIYHEQRDHRRLVGTVTMTVLVILSLGVIAVAALYGCRGLLGRWVRDEQALALLLVLIFLAPIQALDDLLVGMFAVFAKPRAIFFRRYVLAPGLKLAVVIALIWSHSDVFFLALGYLASSLLGLGIYGYLLRRVFRDLGLLEGLSLRGLVMPWREVFGFTIPLFTSELVFATTNILNVVLLEQFWSTTSVASFRAVQPAAKLNEFVMASFATLFTPLAARLVAHDDPGAINRLYWRSAIWIAISSFPIFAVTFSLAQHTTVLLFGARYEQSAPILALLSLGYYFNAALGFNGLTLKVLGKVRYTVVINAVTTVVGSAAALLLVPRMGALGAGIAATATLVVHNLLKQAGLRLGTGISLFEWRYLRVYLIIAVCAAGLLVVQFTTSVPIYVDLGLAALAALGLLIASGSMLEVDQMFPEAMKVPGVRFLVSNRWGAKAGSRR